MRRRAFLKSGLAFTGLIWVPNVICQSGLQSPAYVAQLQRPAAVGGSCPADGSPNVEVSAIEGLVLIGDDTDHKYIGLSGWSDGSNRTICKVHFILSLFGGTIVGKTYKAAIYTMTGTALNSQVALSDGVTGSDAWDNTEVYFPFSSPYSYTASTTIAIVVFQDGAADATNTAAFRYDDVSALIPGNFARWNEAKTEDFSLAGGEPDIGIYYQ